MNSYRGIRPAIFTLCLILAAACEARAQSRQAPVPGAFTVTPKPEEVKTDPAAAAAATAAVKIKVQDAEGKPVERKRFYLLTRSAELAGLDWNTVPAREEFLKSASPELREWLKRHDCDTIYCPEYEAEFESAREAVPEFRRAYAEGLRRYKNPRLALRWLTVNFPLKEVRTRFYETKREWLARAAERAGGVASVMTDERGEAYFVRIKPGSYYVSNLIPFERGQILWNAPVNVPAPTVPSRLLHTATVVLIAKPK